eukprot:6780030-Pyramimonas_sp.AAC.1
MTIDRTDSWRDEDSKYHRPFEQNLNGDSSDGDYRPNRWTGWTECWIREDCAPATQWTWDRLLLEYCCGPHRKIGNPKHFVDCSCKVIRYTETEDMRTDEGRRLALNDIKRLKENALNYGAPCPVREVPPGSM